jgi:hypothetical protein
VTCVTVFLENGLNFGFEITGSGRISSLAARSRTLWVKSYRGNGDQYVKERYPLVHPA